MDGGRYALVEFTDENPVQIEAVPWFWVDEKNSLCTYPPKAKWKFARNFIKNAKQPECSWPRYTCKIVKIFDNYDDAYVAMNKYQDNSDINSTDSSLADGQIRNRRRINQRAQSTSSDDRNIQFSVESISVPDPPQIDVDSNSTAENETLVHNSNFEDEVATYADLTYSGMNYGEGIPQVCSASPLKPEGTYRVPSPPPASSNALFDRNYCENTVCCFHKEIAESQNTKLQNIEDKLQMIITILQNPQFNQFLPSQPDMNLNLPLREVEDFKTIEEDLKKVHIRNAFEEICKKHMKEKCGPTVRSILKATITNKLATQITLTGDKGRLAFKNTKILDIIHKLTRSRFKVPIDVINEEVFQWLRHSKARLKNEITRMQQSTNAQAIN